MSFTAEQLAALKAAYASGVRTVTHGDNSVTYNSMAEMERAISRMERSLSSTTRVTYPEFSRGT